jgi:excisionase family DNA binding protein
VTEPLLTARQVGAWLGMSAETVLRKWRRGEIPGYRISSNALRFDRREIEAWLAGRRELHEVGTPEDRQ